MTDTHTHLYMEDYAVDGGGAAAVRRAIAQGVEHMIFPNVDLASVQPMFQLAEQFPENIRCALGLHPTEVKEDWEIALAHIFEHPLEDCVALGEVGVDLYWDAALRREQIEAFDRQADIAMQNDLPIIIHCRNGLDDTLAVLANHRGIRGVFHSFGGAPEDVERIRKYGDFYFGINGIVTFKNSKLRDTLPAITMERILLETDAPYLSPVPYRGRRNESAFVIHVAAYIAQHLGLTSAEVESITDHNANTLFNFPTLVSAS